MQPDPVTTNYLAAACTEALARNPNDSIHTNIERALSACPSIVHACSAHRQLVAALDFYRRAFEHPSSFALDYLKKDGGKIASDALAKVETRA